MEDFKCSAVVGALNGGWCYESSLVHTVHIMGRWIQLNKSDTLNRRQGFRNINDKVDLSRSHRFRRTGNSLRPKIDTSIQPFDAHILVARKGRRTRTNYTKQSSIDPPTDQPTFLHQCMSSFVSFALATSFYVQQFGRPVYLKTGHSFDSVMERWRGKQIGGYSDRRRFFVALGASSREWSPVCQRRWMVHITSPLSAPLPRAVVRLPFSRMKILCAPCLTHAVFASIIVAQQMCMILVANRNSHCPCPCQFSCRAMCRLFYKFPSPLAIKIKASFSIGPVPSVYPLSHPL